MTWPSGDVDTTGMDSGSDTPPRATFLSWAQKFNQLINHFSAYMRGFMEATDAAAARTTLDVPSRSGGNASGTWGISISGNAASATTAVSATSATNATNASNATGPAASASTAGIVELATGGEALSGDATRAITGATLRTALNASGSAAIVAARAMGVFDGRTTGTFACNDSVGVTSVTRVSPGIYTVTLATALPSTAYSVVAMCRNTSLATYVIWEAELNTTSSFRLYCKQEGATSVDCAYVSFAVFRS